MNLERIYSRLPVSGQNIVCSGYGYLLNRRRYSSEYDVLERSVCSREFWSESRLRDFRDKRVREIVFHAARTVPFYRRLFKEIGADPHDIHGIDDLHALPILTKTIVQENLAELRSELEPRLLSSIVHTSGTTGAGLIFPMTIEAEREQWAVWWRYRARFGVNRKTWYAHFYGKTIVPKKQSNPPFWRVNRPGRQILFSSYHMSPNNLSTYIDELNRRQPPWIQGYPSLLALLATFMMDCGVRLKYRPKIVTVGAETLLPYQEQLIEAAFEAPCRQHYGLTEAVANISECPHGKLHVDEDFSAVEFVPVSDGRYRIIGTGFANLAFPLIRYDTGDVAELPEYSQPCPCGRSGRVATSVDGRIEDYVITPDGAKIGRLDHIFKDMVNIREAQVFQDRVESVVFRIVRGERYSDRDEFQLLREARLRLGSAIEIQVAYVDFLSRTATQKLRFVISSLPEARVSPFSLTTV